MNQVIIVELKIYLCSLANYSNCYCFQHFPELHSSHAANVTADGPQSDYTAYGAARDGPHIARSTIVDHETYTDDSFRVVADRTMPSSPVAWILD